MERPLLDSSRLSERERERVSHDRRGLGPAEAARGRRVFEAILLIWVLAIFYSFYRSQGFFALLQQLASPSP